jgi:hypothetical protein
MASNPAQPAASDGQRQPDFKTEYHPRSNRPHLFQSYEEFGRQATEDLAPDKEPWRPYRVSGDFEFAEIALEAGLNVAQINGLLSLISRVSQGQAEVTLKNEGDLRKAWDNAAAELTPVRFSSLLSLPLPSRID